MAEGARRGPGSAEVLSRLLRRALFWGLARTYPFPPALRALSPRNRQIVHDMWTIRRSRLFDAEWYLSRYPDVGAAGIDPLEHYCRYGWRRGRDPNPNFSTTLYAIRHPEAAKEGNPLAHLARHRARDPVAVHTTQAGAVSASSETFELAKVWCRDDAPLVSIIILNFNKSHLTAECLRAVWRYTEGYPYEIVVVDNGSDAEDFAALTAVSGPFRLLRLQTNRYFGEGNNIGAESARGDLLCFMNNDVIVTPHWLEPLMQVHERHPDCGAVGPKFVYPDGSLQEAGALVDAAGDVNRLGHGADASDDAYNQLRQVDYVSAAMVLLSRADFESVLGFDLAWDPAYYEDTDLCLKISSRGRKIYYCPSSKVVHFESVTTSDSSHALGLDNLKEVNRQKFVLRWGDRYQHNSSAALPAPTHPSSCAVTAREPLRRLAVYAPDDFSQGGSERYILAFADALKKTHRVSLITSERYSRIRVSTVARELGIELGDVNVASLDELAGMERFDIGLVAGREILPAARPFARHMFFYCHVPFAVPRTELARRWAWWDGYERCLVASARIGEEVTAALRQLHLPEIPVDLLPPSVPTLNVDRAALRLKDNIILHVGRFCTGRLSKHQDGLIEAFQSLLNHDITAQLHLAGIVPPDRKAREFYLYCRRKAQRLPVYFHPNASRQQLETLYRRSACFWASAGGNEHRTTAEVIAAYPRSSMQEAQAAGCICFSVGEDICHDSIQSGLDGFVAADAEELVRLTRRALTEKDAAWSIDMRLRAVERAGRTSACFEQRCRELAGSCEKQVDISR
jgi:GT2 family glycosyltransferase/glycosyltransferase involved in cell wall biosynthesis